MAEPAPRPKLTLPPEERAVLHAAYARAGCIQEYGSGGSTVLAAERHGADHPPGRGAGRRLRRPPRLSPDRGAGGRPHADRAAGPVRTHPRPLPPEGLRWIIESFADPA